MRGFFFELISLFSGGMIGFCIGRFVSPVHDRLLKPAKPKELTTQSDDNGEGLEHQLSYGQMLTLADNFDQWVMSTPERATEMREWARQLRELAKKVGDKWSPPKPAKLSLLGFLGHHLDKSSQSEKEK